jgi:hypothetical protein
MCETNANRTAEIFIKYKTKEKEQRDTENKLEFYNHRRMMIKGDRNSNRI